MYQDHEIVVKHLLGKIVFKTRTLNVEEDVQVDKKLTFGDLGTHLESLKGFDAQYFSKTLVLTLEDVNYDVDKSVIYLMINSHLKRSKSTVIKNRETKVRKEYTPDVPAGDRYEHSTHVVIKATPKFDGDHDILIEKTEHLATNIFFLFINKVLFEIAKKNENDYTCKAKLSNKEIRFKPAVEYHSKPDEEFMKNVQSGSISEIVLIKSEPQEIIIPDQNIVIKTKEHTLKIDTSSLSNNAIDSLKKIGAFFKKSEKHVNYDKIKVSFKNPKSVKGIGGGTAYLDATTLAQDTTENYVTKKYVVSGFKGQIKSSYETINSEIAEKIFDLL
ncbi:hypothetical protein EOE67_17395 [Rheinheimera riviphila]|uniref:DUF4747 family protein n=1 Tax=Rheinheimera riviphila TaxID=1834037 RepID=A0A437QFN1_9GAMM|nr:hypothetical protein [Rheinheimera riviphila]RVU33234.1 hypothetical protein EOE67_17395 [Rheinheimera riviphila]